MQVAPPDAPCASLRFRAPAELTALYARLRDSKSAAVRSNRGHATASFTRDVYGHVSQQMRKESAA